MADTLYDFGMIGLGVMGSNLLLNMADHGFKVIGYDKNPDKTNTLESSATKGTIVKGVNTLPEMIAQLQKPRKLMMLVPAGNPVDSVIAELIPLLEEGDIIIDGGNSHYIDTLKRIKFLKRRSCILWALEFQVASRAQGSDQALCLAAILKHIKKLNQF